jgi:two-component system, cell cycle sensor histidine kinase and response regulator CckA
MSNEAAVVVPRELNQQESRQVILVVDDEPGPRDLFIRALRDAGYGTWEAGDGLEALELIEKSPEAVNLVITDVVMPRMDGRELGRRLTQRWPALPILYISAYDVNDIFQRGSPRNSAPFLQKPFPLESLVHEVRNLLVTRASR